MDGKDFVETLKKLRFPSADTLDSDSYDWMFDCPGAKPFLTCFCANITERNLLDPLKMKMYEEMKRSGGIVLEGEALEKALLHQAILTNDDSHSFCPSDEDDDDGINDQNDPEKILELLEQEIATVQDKINDEEQAHSGLMVEQNIVTSLLTKSQKESKKLENSFKNTRNLEELAASTTKESIKSISDTSRDVLDNIKQLWAYYNYDSAISECHKNGHLFFSQLDLESFLKMDEEISRVLQHQYDLLLNDINNNTNNNNYTNNNNNKNTNNNNNNTNNNKTNVDKSGNNNSVASHSVASHSVASHSVASHSVASSTDTSSDIVGGNNIGSPSDFCIEFELGLLEEGIYRTECRYCDEFLRHQAVPAVDQAAILQSIRPMTNLADIQQSINPLMNLADIQMKTSQIATEIGLLTNSEATHRRHLEASIKETARMEVELIAASAYDALIGRQESTLKKHDDLIEKMVRQQALREMLRGLLVGEGRRRVGEKVLCGVAQQHMESLNHHLAARNVKLTDISNRITALRSNNLITTNQPHLQLINHTASFSSKATKDLKMLKANKLFVTHTDLLDKLSSLKGGQCKKVSSALVQKLSLHRESGHLSKELNSCLKKNFKSVLSQFSESSSSIGQHDDADVAYKFLPQPIIELLTTHCDLLKEVQASVHPIVKDVEAKHNEIQEDSLLQIQRKLPLLFYTDPHGLRRSVKEVKNRVEALKGLGEK